MILRDCRVDLILFERLSCLCGGKVLPMVSCGSVIRDENGRAKMTLHPPGEGIIEIRTICIDGFLLTGHHTIYPDFIKISGFQFDKSFNR